MAFEGPLNDRLREIAEGAKERVPGPVRDVMASATRRLAEQGLHDEAPGPGDRAPDFVRPDLDGGEIRLEALRKRGPVVLSFFRGRW